MAAPELGSTEQDLYVGRQAILRALTYVRSQMAALTDHVVCIEKQISCLEQQLTVLHQSQGEAA
jgi:hypothetical protein